MNEPRDGQSWPEPSPPCGLLSFDAAPFGCLRFSSIFDRFPLSIAFPGWSQPVLDLDGDGFGTATFPGAFALRRIKLPDDLNNRDDIEDFTLKQFAERQETLRLMSGRRQDWRRARVNSALQASIPAVEIVCSVESNSHQKIFFIPDIDRSLWSFQRCFDDLDDARTAELLASITWLDPIWFHLLPLVL